MPNYEVLDAKITSTLKEKGQSGGNESSQGRPVPSWKTDRLPDLRVLPGHWSQ